MQLSQLKSILLCYYAVILQVVHIIMGNNSNGAQGLSSKFKELGIDENQLLSTLLVIEDCSSGEKMLVKQMNVASDVQYGRLSRELKQRKAVSDRKIGKYLLRVRDVQGREISEICGKSFRLLVYLEYMSGSLKTVFGEKVRTRRRFEQQQLMRLLKTVVNGLIVLHDNNFKNVHLYKESIVITAGNVYKLLDTQLCNRIHPYFQILNGVPPKTGTYLAPELLADIRRESSDYYHSPKADLFSLAVLILQLSTLTSCDGFYNYERKTVNVLGLKQAASQLPYSDDFRELLLCMLQQQEQERVGLLSLREMITVGNETLQNEETGAFKQSCDLGPTVKNSARTFISRSKKPSSLAKSSRASNFTGQNGIQLPRSRPISQYISNINTKAAQSQTSKRSQQSLQPVFTPIEVQPELTRPAAISFGSVRQTPKSNILIDRRMNYVSTKQYDTPVNLLIQQLPQPEITPLNQGKPFSNKKEPEINVIVNTEVFQGKTYGQKQFSNGALYQGQFNSKGEFDGNGMLYYPGGKVCYSGSWKSNTFNGFGVLHNQHPVESDAPVAYWSFNLGQTYWRYYQGQFNQDKKDGFGTLYMTNGDKFSGCFKNDSIEGFGTFYIAKQDKHVNGIWVNNILKH